MSYVVRKRNGQKFIVLADQEVNGDYSITFTGRNVNSYGEIQQDNFLWLLENFASDTAPVNPVEGQLWFNTTQKVLNVYEGTSSSTSNGGWSKLYKTTSSDSEPSYPTTGETWYDTKNNLLKVYNNGWKIVGPSLPDNEVVIRGNNNFTTSSSPEDVVDLLAEIDIPDIIGTSAVKVTIIAKSAKNPKTYSAIWIKEAMLCVDSNSATIIGANNEQTRIASDDAIAPDSSTTPWVAGNLMVTFDNDQGVIRLYSQVYGESPEPEDRVLWTINVEAIVNDYTGE